MAPPRDNEAASLTPEGVASLLSSTFPGASVNRSPMLGGVVLSLPIAHYDVLVRVREAGASTVASISLGHRDPVRPKAPRRDVFRLDASDYGSLREALSRARAHVMGVAAGILAACSPRPRQADLLDG